MKLTKKQIKELEKLISSLEGEERAFAIAAINLIFKHSLD